MGRSVLDRCEPAGLLSLLHKLLLLLLLRRLLGKVLGECPGDVGGERDLTAVCLLDEVDIKNSDKLCSMLSCGTVRGAGRRCIRVPLADAPTADEPVAATLTMLCLHASLMWMVMGWPVDSIRLAVLTVSPKKQ